LAHAIATCVIVVNGVSTDSAIAGICITLLYILPDQERLLRNPTRKNQELEYQNLPLPTQQEDTSVRSAKNSTQTDTQRKQIPFRIYRQQELNRVYAALLANSSFLIAGEQGSGKSIMADAIFDALEEEGFTVAYIQTPSTPKQMLLEIARQLKIETQTVEGKSLTAEQLKIAIAHYFINNTAFLIVDNAQYLNSTFRNWLKDLHTTNRVPMLVLATDPPRTDLFATLARMILEPLPEYAIREIMEQKALKLGFNLKRTDLARLQQRAGGNPMFAERAVNEEYLGIEVEEGDHHRYVDATPYLLLIGTTFVIIRFIGLGTNDQALYIIGGIAAAIFLAITRVLYTLPQDDKRIR